jgi:signal transduction histidine kinase
MLLIKILFDRGLHSDKLVMIDRTRVQQILLNLISNSLKFSKPGDKVTVTID